MDLSNRFNIIIKKLQSISNIKSGEYWSTIDQRPQQASMITSIIRTISLWECREFNLEDIKTSIESAFDLIDDLCSSGQDIELICLLQTELLNCRHGILNLKTIYYNSETTKTEIDQIVKSIKSQFIKVSERFINIYPNMVQYMSPAKE